MDNLKERLPRELVQGPGTVYICLSRSQNYRILCLTSKARLGRKREAWQKQSKGGACQMAGDDHRLRGLKNISPRLLCDCLVSADVCYLLLASLLM